MNEVEGRPQLRVETFTALGRLVVASGPPRKSWWILVVFCCFPLVGLAFSSKPSTAQVWCSAEAGACSWARNDQVQVRIALGDVDHFEAFAFRQNKGWVTELRAVTATGNLLFARNWPSREFEAAAAGLNDVLAGASAMRSFVHEEPGTTWGDRFGLLFLAFVSLAPLWLIIGPCWLVVDGGGGTATFLWPFRPRRWSAAELAGVQYWSAWNEVSERALRTGQMVPYSLTLGERAWMVLIDHAGRRHRVTRAMGGTLGRAELKAVVARVAVQLGIQALPAVEPLPPGHVPPRPASP
jgi:hypothetical protein